MTERLAGFSWTVLLVVAVAGSAASAQQQSGLQIYEEQLRVRLDEQLPEAREVGVDFGGWFTFGLFHYDDPVTQTERALRQFQLRLWGSANIRGVHKFYFRAALTYNDWNSGDNPTVARGDDFEEEIERAWYQFDLGQMLQNQTGQAPPLSFRLKVGRQFMRIGTSLALSMSLDAVKFDVSIRDWDFMGFLGKTISYSRNIDDSPLLASHQRRCLWGFEVAYRGLPHHRPFFYYLSNSDHTKPYLPDFFQSYDYSSHYVGIGSTGTLLLPGLRYQAELVGEWGKTYSFGATVGQDRICATAVDVGLDYLFQAPTHPRVMFEYLFASGDPDRFMSGTATTGGNLIGTRDKAFNAFGFRDTGIAFAPRISSINMYALGVSCFPFENVKLLEKMEVGTKVFFYHKTHGSAPTNDTTGNTNSRWIGWEWDVYCNWRVTSDLALTLRYGAFQPGAAYDSTADACRQFLYTGMVLSF